MTTPVDCGIKESDTVGQTYMISVHNPSTVTQEMLRFTVPSNQAYKAYKINSEQEWEEVPSDLLCF